MSSTIQGSNNTANKISDKLAQSFNMVVNKFDKENTADIIECTIEEILDSPTGKYKVRYLGSSFEAYSNATVAYKVKEKVYVLVPKGDMSKTKTIISSVSPTAIVTKDKTDVTKYIKISENLYMGTAEVGLSTWNSKDPVDGEIPCQEDETIILSIDNTNFNTIIGDYLSKYEDILFTAKVRTNIDKDRQYASGYYGAILYLPMLEYYVEDNVQKSRTVYKEIAMDTDTMTGNVLNFVVSTTQNMYEDLSNYTYDVNSSLPPKIEFYVSGFPKGENKPADIFFTDIGIYSVYAFDESELSGYYLKLDVSGGYSYNLSETEKTITPELYINGSISSNWENKEVYWFEQNPNVKNSKSDGYCPIGGLYWKCLNKTKNEKTNDLGETTFEWVTDAYNLKVDKDDIITSKRYKCVIQYTINSTDDQVTYGTIEQTVELKRLGANLPILTLEAEGGETVFSLGKESVALTGTLSNLELPWINDVNQGEEVLFYWTCDDINGNVKYSDDDFNAMTNKKSRLSFITEPTYTPNKTKYIFNQKLFLPFDDVKDMCTVTLEAVLKRTVDNIDNYKYIGSQKIALAAQTGLKYSSYIKNGDKVYKYDAYGNSPFVAQYDGEDTVNKTILPLSVVIKHSNGTEFSTNEYKSCRIKWYIPKKSMISLDSKTITGEDENYYTVDNAYSIPYSILPTYKENYTDSTIMAEIIFGEDIIYATTSINCLKNGDNGTNGTCYSAFITYNGKQYGQRDINNIEQKARFIYLNKPYVNNSQTIGTQYEGWYEYLGDKKIKKIISPAVELATGFRVNLYKNNATEAPSYVYWNMFDPTSTKPCFKLSGLSDSFSSMADSKGLSKLANPTIVLRNIDNVEWKPTKEDLDDEFYTDGTVKTFRRYPVNILKAYVVPNEGENAAVYAYYPIEISYVSNVKLSDAEGVITVESTLPSMEMGYSQVLYSSSGNNPSYLDQKFYIPIGEEKGTKVEDIKNIDGSIRTEVVNKDGKVVTTTYEYPFKLEWKSSSNFTKEVSNSNNIFATIRPKKNFDTTEYHNYVGAYISVEEKEVQDAIKRRNDYDSAIQLRYDQEAEIDNYIYNLTIGSDDISIKDFEDTFDALGGALTIDLSINDNSLMNIYNNILSTIRKMYIDYDSTIQLTLKDGKKVYVKKSEIYESPSINLQLDASLESYGYIKADKTLSQINSIKEKTLLDTDEDAYFESLKFEGAMDPAPFNQSTITYRYTKGSYDEDVVLRVPMFANTMINSFSMLREFSKRIDKIVDSIINSTEYSYKNENSLLNQNINLLATNHQLFKEFIIDNLLPPADILGDGRPSAEETAAYQKIYNYDSENSKWLSCILQEMEHIVDVIVARQNGYKHPANSLVETEYCVTVDAYRSAKEKYITLMREIINDNFAVNETSDKEYYNYRARLCEELIGVIEQNNAELSTRDSRIIDILKDKMNNFIDLAAEDLATDEPIYITNVLSKKLVEYYFDLVLYDLYGQEIDLDDKYPNRSDEYINSKKDNTILHLRPIVCLLNRYENEAVNSWDGASVSVNGDGTVLRAPQIAAGKKDNANGFTGIWAGVKNTKDNESIAGLFGFSNGEQNFELNADNGYVTIGKSGKGQIQIGQNGTGTITGGNYDTTAGTGMKIDLSAPTINYGSGNFNVDANGQMTALGGGQLGGWRVSEKDFNPSTLTPKEIAAADKAPILKSICEPNNSDNWRYINFDGYSGQLYTGSYGDKLFTDHASPKSKGFLLDSDGLSIGKFAFLGGNESEQKLELGILPDGKKIVSSVAGNQVFIRYATDNLSSPAPGGFYLGTDGFTVSNIFRVAPTDKDGGNTPTLYLGDWNNASNHYWTLKTGSNTSLAYNTNALDDINAESGAYTSVYLGTDGISLGHKKFRVDNQGEIYSVSGIIGGWKLTDKTLTSDTNGGNNPYIKISSEGSIESVQMQEGTGWYIKADGTCSFSSGYIGGWTISKDRLTGGKVTLKSTGEMNGGQWNISAEGVASFSNVNIVNPGFTLRPSDGGMIATGGKVAGWTIKDGMIESSDQSLKIDSANNKITGAVGSESEWILGSSCRLPNIFVKKIDGINDEPVQITGLSGSSGWRFSRTGCTFFGGSSGNVTIGGTGISIGNATLTKEDITNLHKLINKMNTIVTGVTINAYATVEDTKGNTQNVIKSFSVQRTVNS